LDPELIAGSNESYWVQQDVKKNKKTRLFYKNESIGFGSAAKQGESKRGLYGAQGKLG